MKKLVFAALAGYFLSGVCSDSSVGKKAKGNVIWVDLETTGLDYDECAVLEIGMVITDSKFNELDNLSLVVNQPESVLSKMPARVVKMHSDSGLIEDVKKSKISLEQADQAALDFVKAYCSKNRYTARFPSGSNVGFDKEFIRRNFPNLFKYLYWGIMDISSVRRFLNLITDKDISFTKGFGHRALADIRESIAEARHYADRIIIKEECDQDASSSQSVASSSTSNENALRYTAKKARQRRQRKISASTSDSQYESGEKKLKTVDDSDVKEI